MERATPSRGMATIITRAITPRAVKVLGLLVLVAVFGFFGWTELDSSPSGEALVPIENEESESGSLKESFLLSQDGEMPSQENRRVEASSSDLLVGQASLEAELIALREELVIANSRLELLTLEYGEQTAELDRTLALLSFYKNLCGESLAREFRETRKLFSAESEWQEWEIVRTLFEDLGRIDFSDEDLKEYVRYYLARVVTARQLEIARYEVTEGDESHPRNFEFDEQQSRNAAEYRQQLLMLFNESDVARLLD